MGVYVLGMHRSGTSAVTRVVNLLGVPIGRPERLMPTRADNPAGFWEHLALMEVNDAVLERLGGAWDAPPAPDAHAELDDLRVRARTEFDATYDGDRWVFKDPRVCLLLPFWRDVLGTTDDVAIVVLRNPLDIAASLRRRNEFAVSYSLALWEHYTRTVLRDVVGLPVLVVDYDRLVDDAPSVTDELDAFLGEYDQVEGEAGRAGIASFLDRELRHARRDRTALDADARVTGEQRALYDATVALLGAHESIVVTAALPRESPSTPPLIAARRSPSTPELAALDTTSRALGATEARLDACEREVATMRATYDTVAVTLGYTALGRLERGALGMAGRARRLQQRLARQ